MNSVLAIILITVAVAVVSYLLGSINFAVIFTKAFCGLDVREYGSKNGGMTNVSRVAGKKPAALTFICDALKGAVSVLAGRYLAVPAINALSGGVADTMIDPLFFAYFAGFCCVVGHIYPVFFQFRGGKGVASLFGIMLFVDWRVALIALTVFLIVLAFSHMVSLGSLSAALSLPILTFLLYDTNSAYTGTLFGMDQRVIITICCALYTVIVFYTHRSNIVRIIHGEEKKIGKKK